MADAPHATPKPVCGKASWVGLDQAHPLNLERRSTKDLRPIRCNIWLLITDYWMTIADVYSSSGKSNITRHKLWLKQLKLWLQSDLPRCRLELRLKSKPMRIWNHCSSFAQFVWFMNLFCYAFLHFIWPNFMAKIYADAFVVLFINLFGRHLFGRLFASN